MSKKQTPEDAFYDNLTLGLAKTLSAVPRICNVTCEKRQPCEKAQVTNWEQRHCVYLPEDMKKFYLSTDGFVLLWSYQYASNDIRRVGHIHFPHLLQITLLRENIDAGVMYAPPQQPLPSAAAASAASNAELTTTTTTTTTTTAAVAPLNASANAAQTTATHAPPPPAKDLWGNATPQLTPKTKIFELNNVNEVAKVCLVYESTGTANPKVYLLELATFRWQFLAETFSEYLRMSIAHLGLPFWELCFSSCGLPSWTEQLFLLLAPHLLEDHETRRSRIIKPAAEHPYNMIDQNVFRAKPKGGVGGGGGGGGTGGGGGASKTAASSKHK